MRPCTMSDPGALRPVSAIVLLVAAIGCGGSTSSTSPTLSPPTTPVPSTPSVTSLAVSGTTPQIGATVQFSATATLSNGSSQTVTIQATWSSSNLSVATVNNAGVVSAVGVGESDVIATYLSVSGRLHITILPASA